VLILLAFCVTHISLNVGPQLADCYSSIKQKCCAKKTQPPKQVPAEEAAINKTKNSKAKKDKKVKSDLNKISEIKEVSNEDSELSVDELTEFLGQLKKANLQQVVVRQDNNCMFRAVSVCVHGTENKHMEVRKSIVNYMRDHAS